MWLEQTVVYRRKWGVARADCSSLYKELGVWLNQTVVYVRKWGVARPGCSLYKEVGCG